MSALASHAVPRPPTLYAEDPWPKPEKWIVMLDAYDLAQGADVCWNSVVAETRYAPHEPAVLLRGDLLVRVSHDDGRTTFVSFDRYSLRDYLSRICTFRLVTVTQTKRTKCPVDVVQTLLARIPEELLGSLKCDRITDVPIFAANGELAATPGYNAGARAYFAPAPELGELVVKTDDWATLEEKAKHDEAVVAGMSTEATYAIEQQRRDVREARELLLSVVEEFPFRDEASRAHAVCLMLEPFVRELVGDEPTPLFAVTAHQPRTGKTLLAQTCTYIGCGTIPATSYMNDDDELRKTVTAMILEGAPVVWFDNVKGRMDSGALAGALTSARWTGRILGHTKTIGNMPVRNVWLMTGNNPTMHPELARRVVPIRLDTPKPLGHEYDRPHLQEWAKKARARLVHACIVLVANYLTHRAELDFETGEYVAVTPETQDTLDSFPAWSRVMGGILAGANIDGFLENRDEWMQEAVADTAESQDFFVEWKTRLETTPVSVDELLHVVQGRKTDGTLLVNATPFPLPEELDEKLTKGTLGAYLRGANGSEVVPGFKLVRIEKPRPARWKLEPLDA
ncbi:MAG TPA: hypothetical protein VIL73_08500 [Gaiellaceae bacterium]|jgi:hypothetical protein